MKDNVSAIYTYRLVCKNFARVAKGSASKKYEQGGSSAPACSDDKCCFYLPAFFESSTKRFFVRANSGRFFSHSGHAPVTRAFSDASLSLNNIPR